MVAASKVEAEAASEESDFVVFRTADGGSVGLKVSSIVSFASDAQGTTTTVTTSAGSEYEVALKLRAFARKIGA